MKKVVLMALIFSLFGSVFATPFKVNSFTGNVTIEICSQVSPIPLKTAIVYIENGTGLV